ncbi:threonine synthase [Longirhabdus pacifica]|uniref:threonine synthase n=1 Tax=Longirhabdus pacifica TaxID=2305227 RepID=UPI001008ABD1|nr:threonine synthase [Longirhabdus pacifica]
MQYVSTRGALEPCGFVDAFLMGLADDGGLLVPETIPYVEKSTLEKWRTLSYQDLAFEILSLYTNNEVADEDLKKLIQESYATFRHEHITPIKKINDTLYILELFHGPTFAFKDIALQLIGNLYRHVSKDHEHIIHIIGATSGDTGAAAIEGVRGKEGIKICILHPHEKVSKVQELQMTTTADENVLNLSVRGNFDDCQRMVKQILSNPDWKEQYHLRAVNSINIVRILAQMIYYFYAYFRVCEQNKDAELQFHVPSGNFGDIFAGYLAKKMGLPVGPMLLATNENDILHRFVQTGLYEPTTFKQTYSPAMDIQIASNFERYLYYLCEENGQTVADYMQHFQQHGNIKIEEHKLNIVQKDFLSASIHKNPCMDTIKHYYREYDYLLDPHTACGVAAIEDDTKDKTIVSLATAHPAKFDDVIARCDIEQSFPQEIAQLEHKAQQMDIIDNDLEQVITKITQFFA